MARKRMKDNSDFSITIKYTPQFQKSAEKIIEFVQRIFAVADIETVFPEGDQRHIYTLIKLVKNRKGY